MHLFGGQRAGFRGHRAAQFLTVSLEFCLFGMFKCCCLVDVCDLHISFVPKILGTVKLYHKIVALLLIQVIMAFLVCHTSWKLSCTSFQSFLTKIIRFSLKLCTGAMCLCDASQNENFKPTQIIIACKNHATSLAVVERKIVIQSYPLDLQACRLLRKLNKPHLRPFCFGPHPVDTVPPPTFGDKVYLEHKSIRISSHLLGYACEGKKICTASTFAAFWPPYQPPVHSVAQGSKPQMPQAKKCNVSSFLAYRD